MGWFDHWLEDDDDNIGPFSHWDEDFPYDYEDEKEWHRKICSRCGLEKDCILFPHNVKDCIKHE